MTENGRKLHGSSMAPLEIRGHVNVRTEHVIEHGGYLSFTLRLRDLKSNTEIHVSDHDNIRSALVQLQQYPKLEQSEQEQSND